jgi:HCOMODA/2-hydroxy-3-carboxy-muconic semialdehyde decarboxylase
MRDAQISVRKAARALAKGGLVGPYGHCSVRLNASELLVCAAKPMGTIAAGEDGTIVPISGALPEGVLGEVRVHQQIYQRRADVGAVCRVLPPNVMLMSALGRAPEVRHGFGAFFYPRPAYWPSPALMRSDEIAAGVATAMGRLGGVILRANGAVVAGADIKQAVTLAWFLEDMCRVELGVLAAGEAATGPLLTADEAAKRSEWSGRVAERMWDYLTAGDPE